MSLFNAYSICEVGKDAAGIAGTTFSSSNFQWFYYI